MARVLFGPVGDAGEVWVPAEDGQPGESLETPLVHPEERRDPLLQISCESSHYSTNPFTISTT